MGWMALGAPAALVNQIRQLLLPRGSLRRLLLDLPHSHLVLDEQERIALGTLISRLEATPPRQNSKHHAERQNDGPKRQTNISAV